MTPFLAAIFYAPVALLLLANLFFYWNCQQQIGKQLVYNRSMQHFQVQGGIEPVTFFQFTTVLLSLPTTVISYPFCKLMFF